MKRINNFINNTKILAISVMIVTATYLNDFQKVVLVKPSNTVYDFVILCIIALIGALSIIVFENIMIMIVEKSRLLRHLIMGKEDIEGFWREIVRDINTGNPIQISVDSIIYNQGKYALSGKEFNLDGKFIGSYWSVILEYSDMQSKLVFNSKHIGDLGSVKAGYSSVNYSRPNKKITTYVGYYTDTDMPGRTDVTGQRLILKEEINIAKNILEKDISQETAGLVNKLFSDIK